MVTLRSDVTLHPILAPVLLFKVIKFGGSIENFKTDHDEWKKVKSVINKMNIFVDKNGYRAQKSQSHGWW